MAIDKNEIASALRDLGVRAGDCMGLHSNVPALGRVMIDVQKGKGREGVHEAVHDVIDAFVAAVGGDEGLLMVPTFCYCYSGPGNHGVYHPEKTASRTGLLTDLFFRREDARRSLSPTHPVAAIGARAEQIIKDHDKCTPLGIDSPFHRLAQAGGWICYLGTNSKTLSLLHVAEVIAEVPYVDAFGYGYIGWRSAALVEQEDGTVVEVAIKQAPGCSEGFGKFDDLMEQAGITRRGKICSADVKLFKAQDALDLAVEKLRADPWWLLCPAGSACQACGARRKAVG